MKTDQFPETVANGPQFTLFKTHIIEPIDFNIVHHFWLFIYFPMNMEFNHSLPKKNNFHSESEVWMNSKFQQQILIFNFIYTVSEYLNLFCICVYGAAIWLLDSFFYCIFISSSKSRDPQTYKATAAETYVSISWEYEGSEHVNLNVEYGVAGSKKQFHYLGLSWRIYLKRLKSFLSIYYGSSWKITWSNWGNQIYLKKTIVNHQSVYFIHN